MHNVGTKFVPKISKITKSANHVSNAMQNTGNNTTKNFTQNRHCLSQKIPKRFAMLKQQSESTSQNRYSSNNETNRVSAKRRIQTFLHTCQNRGGPSLQILCKSQTLSSRNRRIRCKRISLHNSPINRRRFTSSNKQTRNNANPFCQIFYKAGIRLHPTSNRRKTINQRLHNW